MISWNRILELRFIRFVIAMVMVGGAAALVGAAKIEPPIVRVLVMIAVLHAAYFLYVRWIERRPLLEFAPRVALQHTLLGLVIGAGLFALTVLLIWLTGGYEIVRINGWSHAWPMFVLSLRSGYAEELFIRGILFRISEESLGTTGALVLSAAIFGLAHAGNPGATFVSSAAIALEAGILLAAAFVFTRTLWTPIAIHFAWNFTQGGIFGINVSGHQAHGLVQAKLSGPELLSGGAFGAEASVFAVLVCVAAAIVLLFRSRRRSRFTAPFWAWRASR